MIQKINHNKTAVVILHEIYGVNPFMEEVCSAYHRQGLDVFCPDLLSRKYFLYSEAEEAYRFFIDKVGFDIYREVERMAAQLKRNYEKVFIIGFSAGATIAWRCCEKAKVEGIICHYGSRIRDYLGVQPACPVLLLFAEKDSFDVDSTIEQLREKPDVQLHKLNARHGFMDSYSQHFDREQAEQSKAYIREFFQSISER
ncbi:dienelactone hydrolase family protein [Clostridium aminobutyricum]|uniref:Dienelactone hydrolase family protein n=1 Tax=Clostridium aminobutyricum TaxID=33953 RepID=A0A939D9J3_CLOAM|nr:dienelactone hydrolase family protein [Clostridium aminobutyricum]MBN7773600.1 dienelactone hydrolase family protein [Clostridium aminobutyricum]